MCPAKFPPQLKLDMISSVEFAVLMHCQKRVLAVVTASVEARKTPLDTPLGHRFVHIVQKPKPAHVDSQVTDAGKWCYHDRRLDVTASACPGVLT